jgi:hypothetical protein
MHRVGAEDPEAVNGPLLRDLGSTAQATAFMRAFFGDKRMMIVEAEDVKGVKALMCAAPGTLTHPRKPKATPALCTRRAHIALLLQLPAQQIALGFIAPAACLLHSRAPGACWRSLSCATHGPPPNSRNCVQALTQKVVPASSPLSCASLCAGRS